MIEGGNDTQFQWFDRGMNMHSLWDSGIIERVSRSEDVWLRELSILASPQASQDVPSGSVEDWAMVRFWQRTLPMMRKGSISPSGQSNAVRRFMTNVKFAVLRVN
jgi:hypothetical protein